MSGESMKDTVFFHCREVCCSLLAAYPEQVASPTIIDLVLQGPIAFHYV